MYNSYLDPQDRLHSFPQSQVDAPALEQTFLFLIFFLFAIHRPETEGKVHSFISKWKIHKSQERVPLCRIRASTSTTQRTEADWSAFAALQTKQNSK